MGALVQLSNHSLLVIDKVPDKMHPSDEDDERCKLRWWPLFGKEVRKTAPNYCNYDSGRMASTTDAV